MPSGTAGATLPPPQRGRGAQQHCTHYTLVTTDSKLAFVFPFSYSFKKHTSDWSTCNT